MKVTIERIDSKRAEELLTGNVHNRSLHHRTALGYAGAMQRGEWVINGETIKLSAPNAAGQTKLLDGQHRLLAVQISNTVQEMILVSGLDERAQETMDQGRKRSLASMIELRGIPYFNQLGGTLNVLSRYWINPGATFMRANVTPSSGQLLGVLDSHPAVLWSTRQAVRTRRELNGGGIATFAALWYLFAQVDMEEARTFMRKLGTGEDLKPFSPTLQLRKIIQRQLQGPHRIQPPMMGALVINAWNAERAGAEWLSASNVGLTWRPTIGQPFPAIDGLEAQWSYEHPLQLSGGEEMPEMPGIPAPRAAEPVSSDEKPLEERIIETLSWKAMAISALSKHLDVTMAQLRTTLNTMEANGEVKKGGNSRYRVMETALQMVA